MNRAAGPFGGTGYGGGSGGGGVFGGGGNVGGQVFGGFGQPQPPSQPSAFAVTPPAGGPSAFAVTPPAGQAAAFNITPPVLSRSSGGGGPFGGFGVPPTQPSSSTGVFSGFGTVGQSALPSSVGGFGFGTQSNQSIVSPSLFNFQQPQTNQSQLHVSQFAPATFDQGDSKSRGDVSSAVQNIYDKLLPRSPRNIFAFVMYNKVPPSEAQKYGVPPNTDRRLWEYAQRYNPDPKQYVPCRIGSYPDLLKRAVVRQRAQRTVSKEAQLLLKQFTEKKNEYDAIVPLRNAELKREFNEKSHILLKIMSQLELYFRAGIPMDPKESDLNERIVEIRQDLIKMRNRTQTLFETIKSGKFPSRLTSQTVIAKDSESFKKIHFLLEQSQAQLDFLIRTLTNDLHDLDVMKRDFVAAIEFAKLTEIPPAGRTHQ